MDQESFDAKAIREALVPRMSRLECAKKMVINYSYLRSLELGYLKWPAHRKAAFDAVVAAWQANPAKTPRQKRSDAGKPHSEKRKRARQRRIMRKMRELSQRAAMAQPQGELVSVG